jgi:alanine racemase
MFEATSAAGCLSIDRAALVANWRQLAALAQGAICSAVVKANAYGTGLEPITKSLLEAGCRHFFVAHIDEGLQLRRLAKDVTIYVLNGLYPAHSSLYQHHNLIPVIGSAAEAHEWVNAGAGACALHIDTGMNRLGAPASELHALSTMAGFSPKMVMSHFVSADIADDPLNHAQITGFNERAALFPQAQKSMANSSGIFLPQKPHYAMVRPGYALYGGNPTPHTHNPMRNVVSLTVPILQIRRLEEGQSVGYNGTWRAKRPCTIATISTGYADGLLRSAMGSDRRCGGYAYVDNHLCPYVGRISMDLSVIDVSAVSAPKRGDEVEILGPHVSIDDLGTAAQTIGYEILTSLGQRFLRKYTDNP